MDLRPHIEKFRQTLCRGRSRVERPEGFRQSAARAGIVPRIRPAQGAGRARRKLFENRSPNWTKTARCSKANRRNPNWRRWPRRKSRGSKRRKNDSRSKSSSASCRRTRRIRATPSSKSAPARAARNPRCSPPIFTGCIAATPRRAAGRSKRWIPIRPTSAASRKSFFTSPARMFSSG